MNQTRLGAALILLLGYGLALSQGQLTLASLPTLLALAFLARTAHCAAPAAKACSHVSFIVLGAALAAHALPGFHNAPVFTQVQFSPGAVPYSMTLNLDKPLIGAWLLLACPWVAAPFRRGSGAVWLVPLAIGAPLALAATVGLLAWAPKWPPGSEVWLANNLLLVSVTEEVLFRGYLQGGLARLWVHHRHGQWYALGLASATFGVAHLALGPPWALVAAFAGAGYGLVYQRHGLLAAVLVHATLNLLHFGLFTYPALLP